MRAPGPWSRSWPRSWGQATAVGDGDHDQGDAQHEPVASSTSDATSGTRSMPAFRSVLSVLVSFMELTSFVGRSFSTNSRPALRAASGRPPARQRHDGHRGTGPTLHSGGTTPIRQSAETEPTGSGPPSTLQIRPATPPKPSITGGQPQTIPCQGDPQPGSARRKRAASARSFAAKSSARSACSLASAARGPP
jgi:hypothetical protein